MTQSCPSKLTVFSLCSPPLLLYLLYAPSRGYADQCPLNLSSASVCAKIIGDSPPAASGANIRSLLLQRGGGVFCCLHHSCRKTPEGRSTVGFCKKGESACMRDLCQFICCTQHPHECCTAIISLIAQNKCLQVQGCDSNLKRTEAAPQQPGNLIEPRQT